MKSTPKIRFSRLHLWFFAALLLCPFTAKAGNVTAYVDSAQIVAGEVINLTIEQNSSGQSSETPDFSVLDKDFDVLDIGKSISTSIINSQVSMTRSWNIRLAPRYKAASVEIPAIPVGNEATTPIHIEVVSTTDIANSEVKPELFMTTSVESTAPYVQQQNVLTLQLFDSIGIQGEQPLPPQADGITFTQLGKGQAEKRIIGGRKYRVYTYRFAFSTDKSGEVTIPSAVFDGYRPVKNDRSHDPFENMFDNFGFGGNFMHMPSVFAARKPVRLLSDPITLNVKPKPDDFNSQWWLPAESVEIFDAFTPKNPTFRVGESVTRTLAIRAKGVLPEQIPELEPTGKGPVKLYPDAPETQTMSEDGMVVTLWQRTAVYIPTKAGTLTLPEITLHWWDTKTNTAQTSRIEAQSYTIEATDSQSTANTQQPQTAQDEQSIVENNTQPEKTATPQQATGIPEVPPQPRLNLWVLLAVGLGSSVAGGLIVFALLRAQGKTVTDDNDSIISGSGFGALKQAARTGEPSQIRDAIIDIAKVRGLPVQPVTLFSIGQWLKDEELNSQLMDLNAALYGNAPLYQDWTSFAADFEKSVKKAEKQNNKEKNNVKNPVEELYPGRSRNS